MASHPGILANPRARDMATETELFLTRVLRGERKDEVLQAEWAQLSRRLSLAADDISVEGISPRAVKRPRWAPSSRLRSRSSMPRWQSRPPSSSCCCC